jgi:cytoskeletal protein CcmA (bactofilin family)
VFGLRRSPSDRIDTLIGADVRFEGDLVFAGGLRIDGEVRGNVVAAPGAPGVLVIGERGRVYGEVRAGRMVVCGAVAGSIRVAGLLEVHAPARIAGELRYGALEVQPGAVIEATLVREVPAAETVPPALAPVPAAPRPKAAQHAAPAALPAPSTA